VSSTFKELEKQARALSDEEKAALARTLIAELDASADLDADQLWVKEAQQRYDAYLAGKLEARPGGEAMKRARNRLK
jgi:hypothetical protein